MKYTNKEYIILALCTAGVVGVLPFLVFRLVGSQWLMATIDFTIILGAALIAIYVLRSRKTRIPSIILTVLNLSATVLVVYVEGLSLIYWAYPAMITAYFLLKPGEAVSANSLVMICLLPIISAHLGRIEILNIVITLILINIFSFIVYRSMHGYQSELTKQAMRDSLTGTGNRRLFDEHIRLCVSLRKRNKEKTSLIMLDIDNFKLINDTFGHAMGDTVLSRLIELLSSRLRESDDLYRIGGDEFAILLRGTSSEDAVGFADELHQYVQASNLSPECNVTISLGVTESKTKDSAKTLLERADSALYRAKNSGRNRACFQ